MDPIIEKYIVAGQPLPASQVRKLLHYPHPLTIVLLDIRLLEEEIELRGREYITMPCLSGREQMKMATFTSEKRKKEWLGGRIAAKHAAATLFKQSPGEQDTVVPFPALEVIADENGRPSLTVKDIRIHADIPDISISHSAAMAAAMAAGKGLCGIDIQKVTPRLSKVQERFCRPAEKRLLQASFPWQPEKERAELAKLWAAKEALRKAANIKTLPGFLELELVAIEETFVQGEAASWIYVFRWTRKSAPENYEYMVFVTLVKDYALALTARGATMC